MITFAELLKAGRDAAGLTQSQLSESSGVHRVYIAQLESGIKTDPSYSVVRKLCKPLGKQFVAAVSADLASGIVKLRRSRKKPQSRT